MAWAASTVRALNSRQKAYLEFCDLYDKTPLPASTQTLALFSVYLVASGRIQSAASVKQYLSSVRTMHRANNSDCATPKSSPELEFTLSGIARHLAKPPKRMSPITPEILRHLLEFPNVTSNSIPWHLRATIEVIRSFYVVLFFSMVRVSSLVPNSSGGYDPRRQLTWDKVTIFPDGAVLELTLTKTIQNAGRTHEVALAHVPNSVFCPVTALKRMAEIRGECLSGYPVFAIPTLNGWVPLSRYHVDVLLTMQIQAAGLEPSKFKFHSFRRGAIQLAIRLEPRLHLIRLQSDHSSNAFEAYCALPARTRFDLTEKMIGGSGV